MYQRREMYPWRGSFIDSRTLPSFRPAHFHCIKFVFRFFIAIWPIVLRAEQQNLGNYFVVLSGFKEVNLDRVCFSDRALIISWANNCDLFSLSENIRLAHLWWDNNACYILECKTFVTCASIGHLRHTFMLAERQCNDGLRSWRTRPAMHQADLCKGAWDLKLWMNWWRT